MIFIFSIKPEILNGALDAILQISREAKFELDSSGITVRCADPSHTEMLVVTLPVVSFVDYNVANTGLICLDVEQLKTMVGPAKDIVTVEKDAATGKVKVSFGKTKYTISLIDPTAIKDLPRLPTLTFTVTADLKYDDISNATQALKGISQKDDEFVIESSPTGVSFSFSDKMSSVRTDIEVAGLQAAHAKYSIEYLDLITKILRSGKDIRFEFGTDYPMRISCKLGDAVLVWLVAPRLEVAD